MSSIDQPDGLPIPRRIWAIITISLGVMLSVLDGMIVNVALPAIAHGLHVTPSNSIWIVTGYQIAILIALLPLASLGEIVGYRRIYLAGLALFTLSSLLCAFAPSFSFLVSARVLQGLGAAAIMSVSPALLRFIYPRAALGRGIGFNVLVVSVSACAGPPIAAVILTAADWPVLFAVNLPLGLAALFAGNRSLPDAGRTPRTFDWFGATLLAMAVGSAFFAVAGLTHRAPAWLAGSALCFTAITSAVIGSRDRRRTHPLVPVDLLRLPAFSFSVVASISAFAAQALILAALPFRLHHVFDYPAAEIGFIMTALPMGVGLAAAVAGPLSERYPGNVLGCAGMILFATGLLLLVWLPSQAGAWSIAACAAMSGAGFGLFQPPNNREILLSAPRERSGGPRGCSAWPGCWGRRWAEPQSGFSWRGMRRMARVCR